MSGIADRTGYDGDAAACVQTRSTGGIGHGLETGRLAAELLGTERPVAGVAGRTAGHYGQDSPWHADCAAADHPRFLTGDRPVAMRSEFLMGIAVRVMGNLVTDEDPTGSRGLASRRARLAPHRPPQAVQLT